MGLQAGKPYVIPLEHLLKKELLHSWGYLWKDDQILFGSYLCALSTLMVRLDLPAEARGVTGSASSSRDRGSGSGWADIGSCGWQQW